MSSVAEQTTVGEAVDLLKDWIRGRGDADRIYGPGDDRTLEMMDATGVNEARREYGRNRCHQTSIDGTFGKYQFLLASVFMNTTAHQVGGYVGTITPIQHGFALFRVDNTLTMYSFFYHQSWAPRKGEHTRGDGIPYMSDIGQHFWWVEKIDCTCHESDPPYGEIPWIERHR